MAGGGKAKRGRERAGQYESPASERARVSWDGRGRTVRRGRKEEGRGGDCVGLEELTRLSRCVQTEHENSHLLIAEDLACMQSEGGGADVNEGKDRSDARQQGSAHLGCRVLRGRKKEAIKLTESFR